MLEKILHRERKTIAQVSEEVRRNTNRISRDNQSPIENERFKMPKNTKGTTEINRSEARARRIEKYETVKKYAVKASRSVKLAAGYEWIVIWCVISGVVTNILK